MENQDIQDTGNVETQQAPEQGWKSNLPTDLQNSPLLQKFEDTPEGLGKAFSSHVNLEKLLGHEKVPIPKGDDDIEGWDRFSKALGIPSQAEGYGLPDVDLPESMKGVTADKKRFAEIAHAHKLTPKQAQGLWEAYTDITKEGYQKAVEAQENSINEVRNSLKGDWGDAYDTKVELGQMVINKFAGDSDTENYITALMTKDPRATKFLAKIGEQFSENKIGDFKYKKFSLTPEEAQAEADKIMSDPNHPYRNEKATEQEHNAAVDYVNRMLRIAGGGR